MFGKDRDGVDCLRELCALTKASTVTLQVKSFTKPPPLVETVLAAVMVLFGQKSDWATAKKKIGESDFLSQVQTGFSFCLFFV